MIINLTVPLVNISEESGDRQIARLEERVVGRENYSRHAPCCYPITGAGGRHRCVGGRMMDTADNATTALTPGDSKQSGGAGIELHEYIADQALAGVGN